MKLSVKMICSRFTAEWLENNREYSQYIHIGTHTHIHRVVSPTWCQKGRSTTYTTMTNIWNKRIVWSLFQRFVTAVWVLFLVKLRSFLKKALRVLRLEQTLQGHPLKIASKALERLKKEKRFPKRFYTKKMCRELWPQRAKVGKVFRTAIHNL